MGLFRLIFILSLVISHLSLAEVRYVSHTGSNTPPYLTWETAADSIMSAINISSFGDTIYVANGVYEEQVVMIPGLSLIGAGADSCIIDTRNFTAPQAVKVKDSCLFKNFKLIIQNSTSSNGNGIIASGTNSLIENNEILNGCTPAIWCDDTNSIIRHNRIINAFWGIYIEFNQPFIDSNYIYVAASSGRGIEPTLSSNPLIRGNIVVINNSGNTTYGYKSGFNNGATLYNNEFYSLNSDNVIAALSEEIIINNVVYGNYNYGIYKYPGGVIKNNVISGGDVGIRIYGSPSPEIKYNDVWNNQTDYYNYTPDSTNISSDPMFVNTDSMDFHLQMYSPLIDAGDPSILDKDGSRSDIGLFGGPYGEKYTYRDLAPKPPSNLTAMYDSGLVLLRWNRNTEADFFRYRVYRDTVADFTYDSTRMIAEIADTFYYDDLPEKYLAMNYYYKITATDTAGHQSAPSEEVQVNITGVPEGPPRVVEHYQLLNNYPNPFNSTTIIPYRLKEPGYVKLYIYDIKGELVRVLVNEYQGAGYYEVRFNPTKGERKQGGIGESWWTGYNDDIATGIYLYQIMVRGEGNLPVFTGMGKMILLK